MKNVGGTRGGKQKAEVSNRKGVGGLLVRATFEVEFTKSAKPRKVHVRPPDQLKVGRHGDVKAVHEWLTKREFRAVSSPAAGGA